MISRDVIKAEVEIVPEERLEELYLLIRNYVGRPPSKDGRSLMAKLRAVEIDGPKGLFPASGYVATALKLRCEIDLSD